MDNIEFVTYGTAGAFLEERFYPLKELKEIVMVIELGNERAKEAMKTLAIRKKKES